MLTGQNFQNSSVPDADVLRAELRGAYPSEIQAFNTPSMQFESEPIYESKKSPFLAGAMSLVVPGAGDIYSENYIMGGVFLIAEAVGWYFNIQQNKKGDDQTAFYKGYADTHWSAVKYAEWLNAYATKFEGGANAPQIPINPDASLMPWERVDWGVLNQVELMIPVFSHRLPAYGAQQYYELIGKYHQYSYGWDDKTTTSDGWSDYRTISRNFEYYSGERGKANDFYNTATTVANLIVVNHILAAANAAWSAARFNKHVDMHAHMEFLNIGNSRIEAVPTATFSIPIR